MNFRATRDGLMTLAIVSTFALLALAMPGLSHAANGSVTYTYDALGRLLTASYDTGVCIRYSYDANGNRLTETILVTTANSSGVWGCFAWGQARWGQ